MFSMLLICCTLIGNEPGPAATTPADRAIYDAAQKKAGKDAGAHVKLSLWCEAHGLTAERMKHLALAIAFDPSNTLARGLSGLVSYQGRWKKPGEVGELIKTDPTYQALIREYLERRVRTPGKADAQLKLAAWCTEKGLKEQALAHYSEVTRLDPSREVAWKHLGYKKHGSHWVKPEDAAAQKLEAEHQKHADLHWKSRLEKLREGLESTHATRRDKAREGLTDVTDPRAVPMIWKVFANSGEAMQLVAVKLLGQIEGPSASNALAAMAVFNSSAEVRQRATEALARRDPRDVVGRLINLINRPYKYKVQQGNGPGSSGVLLVDGESFDMRRLYRFPSYDARLSPATVSLPFSTPMISSGIGSPTVPGLQSGGMPVALPGSITVPNFAQARPPMPANMSLGVNRTNATNVSNANIVANLRFTTEFNAMMAAQAEMMMVAAMMETVQRNLAVQQTLENDIQTIEAVNSQMNQVNDRVLPLLRTLTTQDLGAEPESWRKWWTDQLGYVYQSSQPQTKPTFTDTVGLPDVSPTIPFLQLRSGQTHSACFAAGTLVHTIDGPRAIDSLAVGDRVLSQNTSTGLLVFEPVVATHRNAPSTTLRIAIDGETIVATGIHRFWKAGKGWTMARDLKVGDRLRMVGGVVEIQSIEADATQPVYNLDVAQDRDFFVGKKGLLVHDFSFVQPMSLAFDREPNLAAASSTSRAETPAVK
jgi:tetratricopeptide (TPR) repeat protein